MKQIMLEATVNVGDNILTFHAEMDENDQRAYEAFVEFLTREGWEVMSIYKI
jgi:hypothetical protein